MIKKTLNNNHSDFDILQGLALALLANAIIIPHLIEMNYHPLSIEVIFFFIIIFIPMFGIGYISNWKIYLFFSSFITYWFFDSFFIDRIINLLIIVLIILFLINWLVDKTIYPLACIIFSLIFIFFSMFNYNGEFLVKEKLDTNINFNNNELNYSYLHIILDEHSSLNLIPNEFKDVEFNKKFKKDYISNNFDLYNNVFSESHNTVESLGAIFGLYVNENENISKKNYLKKNNKFTVSVKKNFLAQKLQEKGFKISFIQSNYYEICDVDRSYKCETYTRASNMNIFKKYNIQIKQRLKLALLAIHEDYYHREHILRLYRKILQFFYGEDIRSYGWFSRPLVNVLIFDEMKKKLNNLKNGEALIAHMLLPHYPFVLNENCNLKKISKWNYPLKENSNETIISANKGFLQQVKCTHKKIHTLLEIASKKDNLLVVIHGDHGARLYLDTEYENEIDNFSTFIALKDNNTSGKTIDENMKLQNVFTNFINRNFDN